MQPAFKHAGEMVFPDIDPPTLIKLIMLAAGAWIILAPVLIALSARHGHFSRLIAVYWVGTLVAAFFFTWQSGLAGEPFSKRLFVWARYIWLEVAAAAFLLSVAATVAGRASRRLWPPRK